MKINAVRSLNLILSLILISLLVPDFSLLGSGPDSVCVHFASSERGASLKITHGYTLSGKLPVTFCRLSPYSDYELQIYGRDIEKRSGKLKFDSGGIPRVCGIRMSKTLRNMLLPGWGSVYEGETTRGWIDGLSFGSALYFFLYEHNEYMDLKDQHDSVVDAFKSSDSIDEREVLSEIATQTAMEVNVQNEHRKNLFWFGTALYAYQIFDSWFLSSPPRSEIGAGGNVVRFDSHRLSRWKAMMLSLIKPGSGQYYQGKKTRGALCTMLSTAAGLVALEYYNRYNCESEHYRMLIDQFNESDSIREKNILSGLAARQWEEVEDEKRNRDISYLVLAGIWGYSILDTFFPVSHENSAGESSFSLGVENNNTLTLRLSF